MRLSCVYRCIRTYSNIYGHTAMYTEIVHMVTKCTKNHVQCESYFSISLQFLPVYHHQEKAWNYWCCGKSPCRQEKERSPLTLAFFQACSAQSSRCPWGQATRSVKSTKKRDHDCMRSDVDKPCIFGLQLQGLKVSLRASNSSGKKHKKNVIMIVCEVM